MITFENEPTQIVDPDKAQKLSSHIENLLQDQGKRRLEIKQAKLKLDELTKNPEEQINAIKERFNQLFDSKSRLNQKLRA